MTQRLLEGEVIESGDASELRRLRDTNASLMRKLGEALEENANLKERVGDVEESIMPLREKLRPFYVLLQSIFGDIDKIAPEAVGGSSPVNPHITAIWNSWKQKLGGQCAKIIDVLLTHRDMNTTQLAIAIGTRRQNIPNLIYKMNQAGIINKTGGRFSLKELG